MNYLPAFLVTASERTKKKTPPHCCCPATASEQTKKKTLPHCCYIPSERTPGTDPKENTTPLLCRCPATAPERAPKKTRCRCQATAPERTPKKTPRCIATAHRRLATCTQLRKQTNKQTNPVRLAFIYIDMWYISFSYSILISLQNPGKAQMHSFVPHPRMVLCFQSW
jgi:hypothetical protein